MATNSTDNAKDETVAIQTEEFYEEVVIREQVYLGEVEEGSLPRDSDHLQLSEEASMKIRLWLGVI
jgi:hypothetical protein